MQPASDATIQAENDAQHLRVLEIMHYVVAAIIGLFSLLPLIHVGLGIAMLTGAIKGSGTGDEAMVGWVFVAVGGVIILFGEAIAAVVFLAGRKLRRRQGYTFCIVAAGICCLFMPVGTALGVFTLIVLVRPSVRALFDANLPAR